MSFQDIANILTVLYPFLAAFSFFYFKEWIRNKIQYSTKLLYDKQLEDFKNSISIRTKASIMADLMAEWLNNPVDQKLLHKLTFEAFLWLPKDIANDLSDLLSHKPGAKDTRHILSDVRIHLLKEEEAIEPHQIIIFSQQQNSKIHNEQKKAT